jgi:hypothetical protein
LATTIPKGILPKGFRDGLCNGLQVVFDTATHRKLLRTRVQTNSVVSDVSTSAFRSHVRFNARTLARVCVD